MLGQSVAHHTVVLSGVVAHVAVRSVVVCDTVAHHL